MTWRQRRARNRILRQAGLLAPVWLDVLGDLFGYTILPRGALTTLLNAAKHDGLEAKLLAESERESRVAADARAAEAFKLAGEILGERTMAETEIEVLTAERDRALAAFDNDHGDRSDD